MGELSGVQFSGNSSTIRTIVDAITLLNLKYIKDKGEYFALACCISRGLPLNTARLQLSSRASTTNSNYRIAWGRFVEFLEEDSGNDPLFDTREGVVLVFLEFFNWLVSESSGNLNPKVTVK
jgi:hypothetical protein